MHQKRLTEKTNNISKQLLWSAYVFVCVSCCGICVVVFIGIIALSTAVNLYLNHPTPGNEPNARRKWSHATPSSANARQPSHWIMSATFGATLWLLTLLAAVASSRRLAINKCCNVNEELDAKATQCVQAKGNPYAPAGRNVSNVHFQPLDHRWLSHWLPPGIPPERIEEVWVNMIQPPLELNLKFPVNASVIWNGHEHDNIIDWDATAVFHGPAVVFRNKITGLTVQILRYCIDATQKLSKPFGLLAQSRCPKAFGTIKCCRKGDVIKVNEKIPTCQKQEAFTTFNISFSYTNRKFPECKATASWFWDFVTPEDISHFHFCVNYNEYAPYWRKTRMCADFFEHGGTTRLALVYCQGARPASGMYYYCRYLPFVSMALLVAALAAIACSARQRTSAHGWALASHAACLLLFNAGQVVFLLITGEHMNEYNVTMPLDKMEICLPLAFSMHFCLVAAASWLTAVSVNMTTGFKVLPGRRAGGGRERRRFLRLCAGAWGFPVLLSAAAIATFQTEARPEYYRYHDLYSLRKYLTVKYTGSWYLPSFMETRTCLTDIVFSQKDGSFRTNKLGSLLFYFGPLSGLLVANVVCLSRTARRVHFLRRGNSLLQREREEGGAAHTARAAGGALTQAQSILVYIKLLLSAGLLETVAEIVSWAVSASSNKGMHVDSITEHSLVYRGTGTFCDLLRALCVLWLAAPGAPGHVAALWKRLRTHARESKVQ